MPESHPLDNPIWHSLRTGHSELAVGDGLARCYPADIGPLSGTADQSTEAYEALRILAGTRGVVGIFLEEPYQPRAGWSLLRGGPLTQMIFNGSGAAAEQPSLPPEVTLRLLTHDDVPAMVELAELAEPGPFRRRTAALGTFFGIFDSERLLAMAGQRMRPAGFIEVSAVCTHPDARGHGYAQILTSCVVDDILPRNAVPFLHSLAENLSAIRIYERCGFVHRRALHFAVLRNDR
jgi:ribosomal protein S18 acetylase RimI-like enzyme